MAFVAEVVPTTSGEGEKLYLIIGRDEEYKYLDRLFLHICLSGNNPWGLRVGWYNKLPNARV